MKLLKRIETIVHLCLLVCLLSGCGISLDKPPFVYTFRQECCNISKVEICAYEHEYDADGGLMMPLAEIKDDDINAFLDDIRTLDCYDAFHYDPIDSFGEIIIRIQYIDGEAEIIGMYNIGWLSEDHKLEFTDYYFHYDALSDVIAKYVDPQLLSEYCVHFQK